MPLRFNRFRTQAVLVWGVACLSACGSYQPQAQKDERGNPVTPVAAAPLPPAAAASGPRTYLLQASDNFDVKFFLTPELNENVVIRPDGKISLQLVGEVQAAGLSVAELEAALLKRYAKELRDPEISVIVKSYSPQRVFVAGEVRAPGEFVLQGDMTALQAIARAGFFTPDAQASQVVVLRYKGPRGPEFITLDAGAMLNRPSSPDMALAHATRDVVLEPMDVVYVAQTRIAGVADFFGRYINNILPLWRNLGFSAVYYTNTAKVVSTGQVVNPP